MQGKKNLPLFLAVPYEMLLTDFFSKNTTCVVPVDFSYSFCVPRSSQIRCKSEVAELEKQEYLIGGHLRSSEIKAERTH